MKKTLIALTIISLFSCVSKNKNNLEKIENIELITDAKITLHGDPTSGILVTSINQVDSVHLTSTPEDYPNLELEIIENRLYANVMRIGDFPYQAEIFSNSKIYLLTDTLRIRPPKLNVSSRFGFYLIAEQENWIDPNVNGFLHEEINVTTDRGNLIKKENGRYILEPLKEGVLNVYVSVVINGKQRNIGKQQMFVVNGETTFNKLITPANIK